ncbi:hypothetical protein EX30DRAFT_341704 [Ascodesmis nigricans]|uniref:Invertebrate defensins family profile domain-containing protein n=1 Tax=Ascodesmis nigricans TaxID=341454 RepID=A0A4S2MUC1_9PEZI|nr:hypothetical protein EX30DRAFT_341704 [Ascodesmis nigricans]
MKPPISLLTITTLLLQFTPLGLTAAVPEPLPIPNTLLPRGCGDGAYCFGFGGGAKCNDHCITSCAAKRGSCGGFGWQTCQCFYAAAMSTAGTVGKVDEIAVARSE